MFNWIALIVSILALLCFNIYAFAKIGAAKWYWTKIKKWFSDWQYFPYKPPED